MELIEDVPQNVVTLFITRVCDLEFKYKEVVRCTAIGVRNKIACADFQSVKNSVFYCFKAFKFGLVVWVLHFPSGAWKDQSNKPFVMRLQSSIRKTTFSLVFVGNNWLHSSDWFYRLPLNRVSVAEVWQCLLQDPSLDLSFWSFYVVFYTTV